MCFSRFDWRLTDFILLLDGKKLAGSSGLRRAPWRGLGVVDPGRRRALRVDRAWMYAGDEKTENAKPGDRSPSPRDYYRGRGIFESFKFTSPYKVLISILNITALIDRDFQNRAAGKCDNVTGCDGACDTLCTASLIIINNNNNKLYIYIGTVSHCTTILGEEM